MKTWTESCPSSTTVHTFNLHSWITIRLSSNISKCSRPLMRVIVAVWDNSLSSFIFKCHFVSISCRMIEKLKIVSCSRCNLCSPFFFNIAAIVQMSKYFGMKKWINLMANGAMLIFCGRQCPRSLVRFNDNLSFVSLLTIVYPTLKLGLKELEKATKLGHGTTLCLCMKHQVFGPYKNTCFHSVQSELSCALAWCWR